MYPTTARHPIRTAFLHLKVHRLNRFLNEARFARQLQHRHLFEKIARNASSQFGRDHGFGEIRTLEDFRKRVPLTDYEYHRPYINRVMEGETKALFDPNTRILMFAMTSGTTSTPKHLPVTEKFYQEYRASWQLWGTGVYRDYPHLLGLSTLQLSSHWQVSRAPCGIPCGNISGLAAETRPPYIRSLFVLPNAVVRIMDSSAKHYTALRLALATSRIGMVITANPSTLVEFAKRCNRERESLIKDIHNGTLNEEIDVSPEIRNALRPALRRNPQRAKELEAIVEKTGNLHPKEAWPHLTMTAVWTGGSVGIYLPQLDEFYGDTPIRDHGISASEGRMSIPLVDGTSAGMLDYRSHFYEFIPEDEYGSHHPTFLEAHELKEGENYFIVLTTSAGLYRYDIADLVRCEGYEGQSPRLTFVNKAKHFSNITGEKLSEHQVVQAMRETFEELDLPTCTFTLAPVIQNDRPRYRLLLTPGVQAEKGASLGAVMQRRLEALNIEYRDKCQSGRILPIEVFVLPSGTWRALREARSRQRGNFEEFKHPCLTNDIHFVEKLPKPGVVVSSGPDADGSGFAQTA